MIAQGHTVVSRKPESHCVFLFLCLFAARHQALTLASKLPDFCVFSESTRPSASDHSPPYRYPRVLMLSTKLTRRWQKWKPVPTSAFLYILWRRTKTLGSKPGFNSFASKLFLQRCLNSPSKVHMALDKFFHLLKPHSPSYEIAVDVLMVPICLVLSLWRDIMTTATLLEQNM